MVSITFPFSDLISPSQLICIAILLDGIVCGCLTSHIAMLKDYSTGSWFAVGFFFGIFGLIASVGLPLKKNIIPNYKPSAKFLKNIQEMPEENEGTHETTADDLLKK
jgi:hypothetical protein